MTENGQRVRTTLHASISLRERHKYQTWAHCHSIVDAALGTHITILHNSSASARLGCNASRSQIWMEYFVDFVPIQTGGHKVCWMICNTLQDGLAAHRASLKPDACSRACH